ncbi:MAG: capsule assembly Wzi family protein [Candidatus Azobacteroides sp.]|nr:capsule assembly Wzi family protein [Candidatus Azobacteroides sp.]
MEKIYIVSLLLYLGFLPGLFAQQKHLDYRIETFGSVATGDHTPFWMLYHNWGMVPLKSDNGYLRGGTFYKQELNQDWSFNAGMDLAISTSHSYNTAWIQQLYGELNWRFFRLNIGSKEDYLSLLDKNLSSGDFVFSNNSRPIPEIRISIPEFILVPHSKGNFYIKGNFSVGKFMDGKWMENTAREQNRNYTKNVLSHFKSIYFRFGNIETRNKLQFTVGMDHRAQWGGEIYRYDAVNNEYSKTSQPHGLSDFMRVLIAKEGRSSSSEADQAYAAGSHWGAYLFKLEYKLNPDRILSAYVQHFYEDGSGMVFENYWDNLLGIQYQVNKKNIISKAVFEYIYTKHQTGPVHFNITMDEEHSHLKSKGNGNDNYYNNVDYVQGPSYFGRTLGTPLFLSPEYNRDGHLNFKSNRIIAFHLGVEGYFTPDFSYRLLATTGETWGRYYVPYINTRTGFASNLELIYDWNSEKIKELELKLSLGFNKGEFFDEDSWGAGITITKRGIIHIK